MFKRHPAMPVDVLLEPLLKQLSTTHDKTYVLNVFDFEFLVQACGHPRLDASLALSFLDFLSSLYVESFIYAKLVFKVIQLLTNRFCEHQTIVEFLKKNL